MLLFVLFMVCVKLVLMYNLDINNALIYTLPSSNNRSSYFGYTVAIRPRAREIGSNSWVLQIGAPRSNGTLASVREPGAVYRCYAYGQCNIHGVDVEGNQFYPHGLAAQRKDDGWLGVAMSLKLTKSGEMSVVCGHRISYQSRKYPPNFVKQDRYLTVGGCFLENVEQPRKAEFLMPLKNEDRAYSYETLYWNNGSTYKDYYFDWALSLAGMSAHLTSDGLVLGVPHIKILRGSILAYSSNFTKLNVAERFLLRGDELKMNFFQYNGYSVISGNFFDDKSEWYIFGAPRGSNLQGKIYPAKCFKECNGIFTIKEGNQNIRKGTTYGEYFGASLDAGDINGDGIDDLVVGAPMFSRNFPDQGRIYVYLGSKKGFQIPQQAGILDGKAPLGRFGTCVSVAGDLDHDGYNDVIVGAPYEDGVGAVFIYRGGKDGLSISPDQVISAKSIHPDLRGFGISISHAIDLDNNFYPDTLIGAYESDQAVLIRARPVLSFSSYILVPKYIDRKQTTFKITACLAFTSKQPLLHCYIDARLIVDEKLRRARVEKSEVFVLKNIKVNNAEPKCINLTVSLNMSLLQGTFKEPIEISLENSINDTNKKSTTLVWSNKIDLVPTLPVLDIQHSKYKIFEEVGFAGDCGLDKICHSNLSLRCQLTNLPKAEVLLGSNTSPRLEVSVVNSNETAHNVSLHLHAKSLPSPEFEFFGLDCSPDKDNATILCNLKTLREGAKRTYQFLVHERSLRATALSEIVLFVSTRTTSNDTGGDLSKCNLALRLTSDADAQLVAHASVSTIVLPEKAHALVNFSHVFEVEKTGISPIQSLTIYVSIPSYYHSTRITSIIMEQFAVKPRNISLEEDGIGFRTRLFEDDEPNEIAESALYLNCSSGNVTCETFSFTLETENENINISISLDFSKLDPYMANYDAIIFSSSGRAVVEHLTKSNQFSEAITSTTVTKFIYGASLDVRIIILSVLIGIFLLALVLPVLVRKGFFRRKVKEQLEALKVQDIINQRFSVFEDED